MHSTSSLAAVLSAGLSIRSSFALPLDFGDSFNTILPKRAGPIVKYQALGDSYSAGNQAGNAVNSGGGGNNCQRTDGSYAYQLMNDPDVVNQRGSGYQFSFLACSGATSSDEYSNQIQDPSFGKNADLYTVTAGGNDMNFGDIVKHCVYSLIFGNAQCDNLLQNIADQTANIGTDLGQNLNTLYSALATAKGSNGRAVVLLYVRFYPDDGGTGDPLNCVTGSSAQTMRSRLNTAVHQLNSQLVAIAKEVNIDIVSPDDLNAAFNGYRFCESNSNIPWVFDEIENELQWQTSQPDYDGPLVGNDTEGSGGLINPLANQPLDPGTAATVSGISSISGIFHPTRDGYTVYEKALKAHLLGQPAPGPPSK